MSTIDGRRKRDAGLIWKLVALVRQLPQLDEEAIEAAGHGSDHDPR